MQEYSSSVHYFACRECGAASEDKPFIASSRSSLAVAIPSSCRMWLALELRVQGGSESACLGLGVSCLYALWGLGSSLTWS